MFKSERIHNLIYLGFVLALAIFLKIPSLFEPNHYGDEGIYQAIGQVIKSGGLLYQDVWDNKPPLLYLVYALSNGDQLSTRLLSLIFGLLAISIFYFLAQRIFSKRSKLALGTTLLFAILFSLPLLEGNIANAENFMLAPIILAFYLVFKNAPESKTTQKLHSAVPNINLLPFFLAGLFLAFSFLFKIIAIFDLGALLVFTGISLWNRKNQLMKGGTALLFGFALPIILTGIIFGAQGTFRAFLSASFSQNVSYIAWGNKLLIAQGALIGKIFLLAAFCFFLFWRRKNLSRGEILVFSWWGFSLFNAFFAGRPWIHYLLVLIIPFCLMLGLVFSKIKFRFLALVFILLTLLAGTRFWIYGKTFDYYQNFYSFILGQKSLSDYRDFWGDHVNRDYRVAEFIKSKTSVREPVFIWGNDAQIYVLANRPPVARYVVAYHMGFSPSAERDTTQSVLQKKPRYFIILESQEVLPPDLKSVLTQFYRPTFEEKGYLVYEKRR
ncbi:MAG: hypothetical protein Q8P89_03285 [bacterium]|nr:hypothetical protein [bacterium]